MPNDPQSNPPSSPGPVAIEELIDNCMGDASVAQLLVEMLGTQLRGELPEMKRLAAEGITTELARLAHGLKGAAAGVAAHPVRDLADEIETHARNSRSEQVSRALAALEVEVERFWNALPELKKALKQGSSPIDLRSEAGR